MFNRKHDLLTEQPATWVAKDRRINDLLVDAILVGMLGIFVAIDYVVTGGR
jgi:hypothetical protein